MMLLLAMQLHDFSEMQSFPAKLKYMCICLSEVIFMEGFMRKIYNFINGLEVGLIKVEGCTNDSMSFTSDPTLDWHVRKGRGRRRGNL